MICLFETESPVSIERRNFPQFFITAPAQCPYLSGRIERKVFTHLIGSEARPAQQPVVAGGIPAEPEHRLSPGVRRLLGLRLGAGQGPGIRAEEFLPPHLRRNADVVAAVRHPKATGEQYSLFRSYIDDRHADGGMADMTVLDFAAMIDDSFVDSRVVEYRIGTSTRYARRLRAHRRAR